MSPEEFLREYGPAEYREKKGRIAVILEETLAAIGVLALLGMLFLFW